MSFNLHTHSTFSDGRLSPEEIAQAAISAGLSHIAITDHFATKKLDPESAVGADDLQKYIGRIDDLKQSYSGQIAVLAGLEIDFSPERTDFDFVFGRTGSLKLDGPDLVLLEYVNDEAMGGADLNVAIDLAGRLDCPVGLAHTDLAHNFAGIPPERLVTLLGEGGIFVELSSAERYRMPSTSTDLPWPVAVPYYRRDDPFTREFFRLVKGSGVWLSVGSDSHDDPAEVADVEDAFAFISEMGLEDRLIINLPLGRLGDQRGANRGEG